MSRGQKNSLAKMMWCSLCCRQGNQLRLGPKANPYVSTWFCSKSPASLRGRQGIRWGSFQSPRFWRREFFRPLDNKKGFLPPDLNFFTASSFGGRGKGWRGGGFLKGLSTGEFLLISGTNLHPRFTKLTHIWYPIFFVLLDI